MPTEIISKSEEKNIVNQKLTIDNKSIIVEISEDTVKNKIYNIRGQQVMLDSDLAEIYGYTTKRLNEQVKRNIDKFPQDFMFQLSYTEVLDCSRSQIATLNNNTGRGSNIKYFPYAFTEQGIYMLMTVLKGELATQQSIALVRTFKQLKDYIIENKPLIEQREYMQLKIQSAKNSNDIASISMHLNSVEGQISDIMEKVDETVKKSDLADMMNNFISKDNGYLIYKNEFCYADVAYASIYQKAKHSIYVVDNYIGPKTLIHLKNANPEIEIILFSDNVGNNKLHNTEYLDFHTQYPAFSIKFKQTNGKYHDRFIVIDYGTDNEMIFHCGASSKNAGARITSIVEDSEIGKYKLIIDELLNNDDLILPT